MSFTKDFEEKSDSCSFVQYVFYSRLMVLLGTRENKVSKYELYFYFVYFAVYMSWVFFFFFFLKKAVSEGGRGSLLKRISSLFFYWKN